MQGPLQTRAVAASVRDAILMNRGRTRFESGKFAKLNNDTGYCGRAGGGEKKKNRGSLKFSMPLSPIKIIISLS